ncbi:MAG: enoyl-CoA hydratase/isomerase family protein [Planctomycetota bacterium]|nr:enoyl-CoA hydratase/isomerase family protein [Planctomycetota bacterium]
MNEGAQGPLASQEPLVTVEQQGAVRYLTLCNPPANCYSHAMMKQLDQAVIDGRFCEETHVIVLRGAEQKFFCAGADIGMLQQVTPEWKYNFCLHANETLLRLEQTPKLVIAQIEGHCVGGGLEVALACDLRIGCSGSGKVGVPEVQLGVLPGTGGTQRLARTIGKSKAMQWCIDGRMMEIDDALAEGLIDRILPAEGFQQQFHQIACSYCPPQRASLAVGLIKRSIQSGLEMGLHEGLALERELQQRLFTSDDAGEGISAHQQKRPPKFKGR